MPKFCLKFIFASLLIIFLLPFLPQPVFAHRTITSATLNGSSSVTVEPSASITAQVNVTTGGPDNNDWRSTSYQISGFSAVCIDHINHNDDGMYSESFTITAPGSDGTYDVSFIGYRKDGCTDDTSNTYTLMGGIVVSSATPTSTPTPSPTAGPTPSPGSTTAPTSTPAPSDSSESSDDVIYPSITLTNKGSLFEGTASISHGVINLAEYSTNDGNTWQKATPKDGKFDEITENFLFSLENFLTVGVHKIIAKALSLAGVATQSANYASITLTILPPKVTLDKISPNPTKDQTPTISGVVSTNYNEISKVQVSLDDGKTWFLANLIGNKFNLTTDRLEDGNYQVRARVFDVVGNIGESESQVLIIDTIPPIIGGNIMSLGSQILTPDQNGTVRTVAGVQNTIVMSMRGGVIKTVLDIQDDTFDLAPIEGTNLWTAAIIFDKEGEKTSKLTAIDGAGNITERKLNPFLIEKSGKVININDQTPLKDASVSLYFFETISKSWVLWDGSSFGQNNPQITSDQGTYNFIAPPGRYYLEAKASNFRTMRSKIFDLESTTSLVATFPLSPKPRISFKLPVLGEVDFAFPFFFPAQTLDNNHLFVQNQESSSLEFGLKKGDKLPDFSLPDLDGNSVNLSGYRGKPFILSFLSTWSPPSNEQVLVLEKVNQSFGDKQVVLAVFLQDSPGEIETFMKRGNYNFNVAVDKNGKTSAKYQISTLPQHFFINSKGIIDNTFSGVLNEKDLLEKIGQVD